MEVRLKLVSVPSSNALNKMADKLSATASNGVAQGAYNMFKKASGMKCKEHPTASNRIVIEAVKGKAPK